MYTPLLSPFPLNSDSMYNYSSCNQAVLIDEHWTGIKIFYFFRMQTVFYINWSWVNIRDVYMKHSRFRWWLLSFTCVNICRRIIENLPNTLLQISNKQWHFHAEVIKIKLKNLQHNCARHRKTCFVYANYTGT